MRFSQSSSPPSSSMPKDGLLLSSEMSPALFSLGRQLRGYFWLRLEKKKSRNYTERSWRRRRKVEEEEEEEESCCLAEH